MDDDEQVSVPGEGDEIMEEPEEQEDGYSTSILALMFPPPHLPRCICFLLVLLSSC